MVLHNTPEFVEIKRPELKRKMGMIYTKEQVKCYRTVSLKRASRGEGENQVKLPFGCIE